MAEFVPENPGLIIVQTTSCIVSFTLLLLSRRVRLVLGPSKDLDPLLDGGKFLVPSWGSSDTKWHNGARLPFLWQVQKLDQTLLDFGVHSSKVLQRSSDTLFGEGGPDYVLEDTSRVLGPGVEFLLSDQLRVVCSVDDLLRTLA